MLPEFGGAEGSFMRFIYSALTMTSLFISAFQKSDKMKDLFHMEKSNKSGIESFDFIIVGGGTAGSIVANRLSETYSVLLLEAGGEAFPLQSIPGLAPYMINHKEIDWMYKSVSQKNACQALNKHRTIISQGKGLGGSSNLGYLNYLRGSPFDYESWANLTGNRAWKYSSLLPYFKRHETYDGAWKDRLTHGFEGELNLQTPNYTGMGDRFIRAGMEMKYNLVDLNGLFTQGFDYILSPLRRGYRQSSASAYINNIRPRLKLTIRKFSNVQKILFTKDPDDSDDPAAYGVVYERHGQFIMSLASKEVILSAGVVNSPKLLILSGIGPKNHLESMKIQVLKDLPAVGKNLQDHLVTYLGPFILNSSTSFLMDRDLTPESVARFGMAEGKGPLTSSGVHANAIMFSAQQKFSGKLYLPDLHFSLYGMSHHKSMDKEFQHMFNLDSDIADRYFNLSKGKDSFSIIISNGKPSSRGRLRLQDSNPETMPIINPRYLSDQRDMDVMMDGIYKALYLIEHSQAFKEIGAELSSQPFPGCEFYQFKSEEYWQCYIRMFSMSGNNLVGSCSMGPLEEIQSHGRSRYVVDSNLKVYGIQRLRIVDASVIPEITVGGTLGPTMVIAEKASDIIKSYWEDHSDFNQYIE